MPRKTRFITSAVATASGDMPALPFQRGAPRKAMIARRKAKAAPALRRTG